MSGPQLPHLETFVKVAELSSFTAAAHALDRTQAAVSQRVQALEGELGVSLFHRRGNGVLLTDAGRRLYPVAQQILRLYEEARAAVTGQPAPVQGELSLGASSVPGEHLLPALLSAYRQRYPHVQLRAAVADSRVVQDQVEHGQVHLGLIGARTDRPHLACRPFACDRMALIVPAGHTWARRNSVALGEVALEPLVVRETGSGSRLCLEQALSRSGKGLKDFRIALELGSNEGIKEAVLRGLGLAVLSTHVVQKEVDAGQLHALPITDFPLEREMFVVWDTRRALPLPARLFLDLLAPNPTSSAS
jgi:LysR family transcriptional regulator, low CO2-responsive transcriptional regulator